MKKLLIIFALMFLFAGCSNNDLSEINGVPTGQLPQEAIVGDDDPVVPQNEPEPEPPPPPPPSGPMHDPDKIYFHDTYNQIADNPSVMWGDFHWDGWFDVMIPLTHEADRWYSFEKESGDIMDNYKMIIFFNGLPDNDPGSIQWVWNSNVGFPNGNYFIADMSNFINPPSPQFAGEQRDATTFATFEEAEAATKNVVH